jgi:hypothetical protein
MELTFLQKIVFLALDDKGWFGASEHKIKFGLVGAILFELYKLERITITNDEVVVINAHSTDNVLLDRVLNVIKTSKKQRSPRSWIQRIVYKKLMLRKTLLKQLIQMNLIGREEYSLMVVFYQTKFPLIDSTVKRNLQMEICDTVISGKSLSDHDLMLLVIMNSCRMIRKNFGGYLQYIKLRGRINEITQFPKSENPAQEVIRILNGAINRAIIASKVALHV